MDRKLIPIFRKRRIILKTNEKLGSVAKSSIPPLSDSAIQDQGFTRPSVLFLLPFRSSALSWLTSLTTHTPSPAYQIENHARFLNEYGLPPGTVDKLATAEPGAYPPEHVAMFKGNIDEAFRVGVKITRKSVKLFSEFYGSDIILASPLGLKLSIEKEKWVPISWSAFTTFNVSFRHADFLSSIEIVVVDQMDALTMQNWDHVKVFRMSPSIFSSDLCPTSPYSPTSTNSPRNPTTRTSLASSHGIWMDSTSTIRVANPPSIQTMFAYSAPSLRQSVLLSAYETPETRALFNHSLVNVAGKIRTEKRWAPVGVPEGVHQVSSTLIHLTVPGTD
jgi:U3 small nucleolar RNA-associated protein 25